MEDLVLFAGLALAVLVAPRRWALGIIAASAFMSSRVMGFDITSLLVLLLFGRLFRQSVPLVWDNPFLRTYGFLIVWAILSVLWAVNPSGSIEVIRSYIRVLLAMTSVVVIVKSERDLVGVTWGCFVGIILTSVQVYLWDRGIGISEDVLEDSLRAGRLLVQGGSSNFLALQIAWATAVALYGLPLAISRHSAVRGLLTALLLASAWVTILRLGSRAALLCLIVSAALLLLRLGRVALALVISAGVVTFAFVSISGGLDVQEIHIPLASETTNERVRAMLRGEDDTGRVNIWQTGILIGADNPIRGVGAGNGREYYPAYSLRVWSDPLLSKRTLHNTFVTIWAELGLVGISVLVMLGRRWVGTRRDQNPQHLALIPLIGFLLFLTGMTHSFEQGTLFMLLVAVVHSLLHLPSGPEQPV